MTQRQLGETTRPRELVAGNADSVRTTASRLRSRADRIDDVSTRLRRLDLTGVWEGEAATSFLKAVAELQPHADFASEADRAAAKALTAHARVLEDAQTNASRAIELWERGAHATRAAEREQAVAFYGASSELLFDPGEAQRANAQRILRLAREDVSDAGNRAASALQDSQSVHASTVGFWDVVGVAMNVTVGETLRGIGNGVASFVNAVAQHPDEWIALLLGVGSMEGGVAAFTGGVALDATVAGAPAGVAVNVAAAGVVAGGAAVTAASMSKLLQQAAGEDRVEPFTNEAAAQPRPAGYSGDSFEEKLAEQFRAGPPKASDLEKFAQEQGWTRRQSPSGPPKYFDENGVERMTIKRGSPRTPGSEGPHVALRDAGNEKIDPWGNKVSRDDTGNHTPIEWDLGE